jgi:cellulose synthase/poly-beta-1,6-N-acetylglucosamine synthase-like glycosyltransferase
LLALFGRAIVLSYDPSALWRDVFVDRPERQLHHMTPGLGNEPALVRVIVPIYNHARFLRACFDSIASETYPNIELQAIDDGSLDGSFDVCARR